MFSKSPEYWVALVSAAVYVFLNAKDRPLGFRVGMVAVSTGLGYSVTPDVVAYFNVPEILALIGVITMGYFVLDVLTSLVSDRTLWIDMIKKKLGK